MHVDMCVSFTDQAIESFAVVHVVVRVNSSAATNTLPVVV